MVLAQNSTSSTDLVSPRAAQSGLMSLDDYALNDRYVREQGRVFLTGTQALVAIMLMQARIDRAAGLNTSGFVSGYRGSPLGAVDQAVWQAKHFLAPSNIHFLPAINEDLAATAVLGTQQVEIEASKTVDGVYAMWYGKGPGVDRSGDALKHGNAYGSSPHGGVLVVAGDDHGCASSSMSHQSDVAFMAWYMPSLNPANIAEMVEYGLYGYGLSRYSGCWVGFKAISETVESAASVILPDLPQFSTPQDFEMPEGGLNFRWPDLPGMQIERRMQHKLNAVRAFARANPIDKKIFNVPTARFGMVTTGKGHLDVMEALAILGITDERARDLGIDIYKIGMVWPLETQGAQEFAADKEELLVIEEKRGIIESQLKEYLYGRDCKKPNRIVGKFDEYGDALITWTDELSPSQLARVIAKRLSKVFRDLDFTEQLNALDRAAQVTSSTGGAVRTPYFCSGCPHNTSTKVPEGSKALAGIGCHFMASWMDRDTSSLIQMGGEGVNWLSKSMFLNEDHIFQNLGDGTYFHSGIMAIRQAIAANTNITYKILFNEAVAMTGGQPVDGQISVGDMARQLSAEGVKKLIVVSDNPDQLEGLGTLPPGTDLRHRDDLDGAQRELRDVKGVTALIYEQTCAAEKRRKRKRGQYPDPAKRVFINDLVCEGCGDCSKQSNCLSVIPKETPFGRKRQIDQSSCNKDYSCVKGFCPSFVTVEGGELRKPDIVAADGPLQHLLETLPEPQMAHIDRTFDLLVGGVGGTGVVTIGAIITMAAHLEGKGASVLDFMGFAQKGGTVLSYVRLANHPDALNQVRIDQGNADAAILCDLVVGTDQRALHVMQTGKTRAIANMAEIPTANFIKDRNVDFQTHLRLKTIQKACGEGAVDAVNANALATRLIGDSVFSNMFLLGYAWQRGMVPVGFKALDRAIELNNVAIAKNRQAFALGRAAAIDLDIVLKTANFEETPAQETLAAMVERRVNFLTDYQNSAYADQYRTLVNQVIDATKPIESSDKLNRAVARFAFKLMAYKDEYEVARLYTDGGFTDKIAQNFTGDYKLKFHLAPPLMNSELDDQGRPKKKQFGGWMKGAFSIMARMKGLRGTGFDIFGHTAERRMERQLRDDYLRDIPDLLNRLTPATLELITQIASIPDDIRGFGPVKEKSVAEAQARKHKLMDQLSSMNEETGTICHSESERVA